MATADVTVIGAGIFGLACAYVCARRGARVQVIEAQAIGAGASGGLVGALAPHVPGQWNAKKQFQLEALLSAEDFWGEVATRSGRDPGYTRTGRLQSLADAAAVAQAEVRGRDAGALWQGRAVWQVVPASAHPNWAPLSPTGLLIFDTLSARIDPRAALAALAAALRTLGGEIIIGEAMPEGPTIWATGVAGLRDLSQTLAREAGGPVKGQAALLAHPAPTAPQIFADGVHMVPHGDGHVAIGSTSERSFINPTSTDALLDDVIARARAFCPALASAPVVERWAGLRPRARSRAPMLGAWPGRPGHYIANGGFKIGFGMAPKMAEVMADLVLNGHDTIPEGFRVEDSL